jgi:outer membrane protein
MFQSMNNINRIKVSAIILGFLLIFSKNGISQNNTGMASDSLSLKTIISKIIQTHPTVKGAEEALNNADARIGLARTGYYPQVDMAANYSNLGPVIKISIPSMGTFQLFPANNYSAAINYRQVVYDFGRTRENIAIETESKAMSEKVIEQVKQKISTAAVNNFYTLSFLQEAIKIKDEELAALGSHLKYVETMKSTGAATDYQILSTQVKISTVESQKVDLIAALTIQQSYLNCLLGQDDKKAPVVKKELDVNIPVTQSDSLLPYAFNNRDEILLNKDKANLAALKVDLLKSLNRPIISFMASGGAKNGFLPDLDALKPNYVLGVGITVPIYDGNKTKYNILQAKSAISSINYENESTRRTITSEVAEAQAYMNAAKKKVTQFELQLKQALKAYSLAQTSFSSGTITNLDLLDANTAVSESRLMLLKAKIDYSASIYRLKAVLGERLY